MARREGFHRDDLFIPLGYEIWLDQKWPDILCARLNCNIVSKFHFTSLFNSFSKYGFG